MNLTPPPAGFYWPPAYQSIIIVFVNCSLCNVLHYVTFSELVCLRSFIKDQILTNCEYIQAKMFSVLIPCVYSTYMMNMKPQF